MTEKIKWKKIWQKGLEKAQYDFIKKETDYKIIKNLNVPLLDKELIKDKEWLDILEKSLMGKNPSEAFEYWIEKGWLNHVFPEIVNLYNIPQTEKYHPEIDCGIHAMMVIDMSAHNNFSLRTRYFALFHDFGKSITPKDILPAHHRHEIKGVPLVNERLKNLNLLEEEKINIKKFTANHGKLHSIKVIKPVKIYNLILELQLDKDRTLAKDICDGLLSDHQGRKNYFYNYSEESYILENIMNEWYNKEIEFEELFKERWNKKVNFNLTKKNINISNNEEIKNKTREIEKQSFYSNLIKEIIKGYFIQDVIKNDNANIKI